MDVWLLGVFWFLLGLAAGFSSIWLKIAVALSEILIGIAIAFIIGLWLPEYLNFGSDVPWLKFVAGLGAVMLTFLAGAELDPKAIKGHIGELLLISLVGFALPFVGCSAITYYLLHWSLPSSLLVGVALSTTSVAIVYAVMLELGFNRTAS